MINTNSVIDGFVIVLGSMPVQFGMFVALLLSISVPKHSETGEYCRDALVAYIALMTTHVAILITKYSQQWINKNHYLVAKSMIMFCLFLQLTTMNFILCNWVYDQADQELLEQMRGEDWANQKDWQRFTMWLTTEQYVFLGSIASGILYMVIRSFFKCEPEMLEDEDNFNEKTDHLQAYHIVIEMNEAFFSVLFTSILLTYTPGFEINDEIMAPV